MENAEHTNDCQQVQDQLLALEELSCIRLTPELAAHLVACDQCNSVYTKLQHLEAATQSQAAAPGALLARERFVQQFKLPRNKPVAGPTWFAQFRRHTSRNLAIAASLLLCASLVLWLVTTERSANASEPLVDRLVDWNVQLSQANSPEQRDQIFNSHAAQFDNEINKQSMATAERDLAQKLALSGKMLKQGNDPIVDAEHFEDINDLLLQRIEAAAAKGDTRTVHRLSRNYARLAMRGLHPKLERAQNARGNNPAKLRRLERIVGKNAELQQRLLEILQKSPDASQKEILLELGIAK